MRPTLMTLRPPIIQIGGSFLNGVLLYKALLDDDRTDVNATNNKGLCCVHQAAVSDSVDTLKLLLQVLSSQQQLFDSK